MSKGTLEMYDIWVMAENGDLVKDSGGFPTIDSAEKRAANFGSRWFFYPYMIIVGEDSKAIKSVCDMDGFDHWVGCQLGSMQTCFRNYEKRQQIKVK